jgi:RNA polymerase sigma factor (sigma-70 family)
MMFSDDNAGVMDYASADFLNVRKGLLMQKNKAVAASEGKPLNALLYEVGQNKDKDAFMSLFDYFAPRIKSYLLKGGLSEDEADELAQETMLMVWQKANSYVPDVAAASTWIFTIARNKRTDYFRKTGRMTVQPPEKFYDLKSEDASPFESFYEQEVSGDIEEALSELSDEQMDIIKKAYYEDKPHAQIAKETGLPLGTVKSRIRLAMEKLRRSLDKRGHAHDENGGR